MIDEEDLEAWGYVIGLHVSGSKIKVYVNGRRYRWWHRLLRRLPREKLPKDAVG
jgi:hypothetical protein